MIQISELTYSSPHIFTLWGWVRTLKFFLSKFQLCFLWKKCPFSFFAYFNIGFFKLLSCMILLYININTLYM